MFKYKKYFKEIISIAFPIVVGNLGHVLMGATDVFVAAKHSVETLSAIAIANSILFIILLVGLGLLNGISIILSNYRGEKQKTKKYFLSGILLSQCLAGISFFVSLLTTYFIPYIGFEENLVPLIQEYMYITSFSIFGMYLYQAIKEFLQAHEIVMFPNVFLTVMVIVNLILNFVFVFGFGSIPAMGITGISVATLIVRTLLGITLVIYTRKVLFEQSSKQELSFDYPKNILKTGFPIGVSLLLEVLGFNIITIVVGIESSVLAGANNLILTVINTTFMVPLAISSAIAIKVGFYNGANNLTEIKNFGRAGLILSSGFMVICSFLYLTMPDVIIGIFTKNPQITTIAVPIISLMAIFEIADGIQTSMGGILKGLKLTKEVTVCVLSSYWFFGIPVGFYLAYGCGMSLKGFWLGLTFSLFVIAFLEYIVIVNKYKKIKLSYEKECNN